VTLASAPMTPNPPQPPEMFFAATRKAPRSLRVLVVDDELLIRWSLSETLTHAGHRVMEAADAKGALMAVAAHPNLDIVLLDYRLPDSNDLALLAEIRRRVPEAAVIMMTAFGSADVVKGAIELGAYRVVSKPFEVRELAALAEEACASRAD
jgi:DNA-binding NtrC family response regulator